jgi:hypothetical protein
MQIMRLIESIEIAVEQLILDDTYIHLRWVDGVQFLA